MKSLKNMGIALFIASPLIIAGCAAFGSDPSPPSPTEAKFFDIATNLVERIVVKTNFVNLTNTVVAVQFKTNEVNEVTQFSVTNYSQVSIPVPVLVTNIVPQYVWKPNETTKAATETVGTITNLIAPGAGILGTGLAALIASLYARLRSSKKTSEVLAQGIEVYGEVNKMVLGTTGKDIDSEVKSWMQNHQVETQTVNNVLKILDKSVDNEVAQRVAKDLSEFITSRLPTPTPVRPSMPPMPPGA